MPTEHEFDVVIVGSGSGGGVVAQELAPLCRDGLSIAVLEMGPRMRPEDYTGREIEMVERLYIESGGIFTRDGSMTIAAGMGYGGSTIVYTGTSFVAPPHAIERWGVRELPYDDLARRSRKYMEQNHVHELDERLINDNNRLFRTGCEALGWSVQQFPVNVRGCRGAGLCNLGCPNGAKMGTHVVQLPRAEAAGVEVITNCRVDRIGDRMLETTVVQRSYGEPSPWAPGPHRVRARQVVLCAGALHSPALLWGSDLPLSRDELGRYFTTHPALVLVARHDRPLTNVQGHPKAYFCDEFGGSEGFLLEVCMYFPFMTAKSMAGFGPQHGELMARMDHQQQMLVLAADPPERRNRITADRDGRPVVDYRLAPAVKRSLVDAMRAGARLMFASGASAVHVPAATRTILEPGDVDCLDDLVPYEGLRSGQVSVTAAHPMGGCRMGDDPDTSVTDPWGRVHGVPWLAVADASLFPACTEVNPYITVMALADRVAEGIRARVEEW